MNMAARKFSRPKRRKPVIGPTMYGSNTLAGAEAEVLRLHVSRGYRERQEWEAQLRALSRRPAPEEAPAMKAAMQSVEQRIVRGLWVLEISQAADGPPAQRQHGIGYSHEGSDVDARYTDAAGGKWEAPAPRPAIPSSKEIDAAIEAKRWIEWLDDGQARLLTVAAMTKRGDRGRRIGWPRVLSRLPQLHGTPIRTLQERYDRALRLIVAELTLHMVGR